MSAVPVPPPADQSWLQVEAIRPLLACVRPAARAVRAWAQRRLPGAAQTVGLTGLVVAIGGLAGVWWAVLAGSLMLAGLGVLFERTTR